MRRAKTFSIRYALWGALLALGAPLGLLVVRSVENKTWPTPHTLIHWVTIDPVGYGYLTFSTTIVFTLLGWILGRRHDRVRREAKTDVLTGTANRREFEDRLSTAVATALEEETELSLLLVDVDHLKTINDEGGHAAGDKALQAVGEALVACSRIDDTVARFGGDEFALLIPGMHEQQAVRLAERLQRRLRRMQSITSTVVPTVSVGVAALKRCQPATPSELFDAADTALYRAKETGRNRVALFE